MSKQLLTVVPSRNLCVNIGFDETATNTFIQAFNQCPIEPICRETTKQVITLDYEFDKMCSNQAFNITTFLTIRTSLTLAKKFASRLFINILHIFKAKWLKAIIHSQVTGCWIDHMLLGKRQLLSKRKNCASLVIYLLLYLYTSDFTAIDQPVLRKDNLRIAEMQMIAA